MSYFFPSQEIKQKRSYLDNWWCHKLFKIYLGSISKTMADREEKKGKTEIQTFEYVENGKNFSDRIKNIFHVFEGL